MGGCLAVKIDQKMVKFGMPTFLDKKSRLPWIFVCWDTLLFGTVAAYLGLLLLQANMELMNAHQRW